MKEKVIIESKQQSYDKRSYGKYLLGVYLHTEKDDIRALQHRKYRADGKGSAKSDKTGQDSVEGYCRRSLAWVGDSEQQTRRAYRTCRTEK